MHTRFRTALLTLFLVFSVLSGHAETVQQGFTQEQWNAVGSQVQASENDQAVSAMDALYVLGNDSVVYCWKENADAIEAYCDLQDTDPAVTHLLSGDNRLWGFNIQRGMLGEITKQGIAWLPGQVSLDPQIVSAQSFRAFVHGGVLCIVQADDLVLWEPQGQAQRELSLGSGVLQLIPYREGQVIYSVFGSDMGSQGQSNASLRQMDLSDGAVKPYPGVLTTFELADQGAQIDLTGLAYNAQDDMLYYRVFSLALPTSGALCRSVGGADFEMLAELPQVFGNGIALSRGRYAVQTVQGPVALFDIAALALIEKKTLTIRGMLSPADDARFHYQLLNPQVQLRIEMTNLTDEDIIALLTGDTRVDIYALFANQLYQAASNKGYAADLGQDAALVTAAQEMMDAIQPTLHNAQGQLVGYPAGLMTLGLWQVDQQLWKAAFGDETYPTTFVDMLRAMRQWQQTHGEASADASVYGPYDLHVLLWDMVYQYIANYETEQAPLTFQTPQFRQTLTAYRDLLGSIDSKGGAESGHSLFSSLPLLVSNNSLLFQPTSKDTGLMLPPAFEEGTKSKIQANALLMMVNVHSPNREEAIRLIRFLAEQGWDPVLRAAMTKADQHPVENPDYQRQTGLLTQSEMELKTAAAIAPAAERSGYDAQLASLRQQMEKLSENRWLITQEGIDRYNEWSSDILFTSRSRYISQNEPDRAFYRDVLSLCKQYADGSMADEGLISSLDSLCRKVYLESK